MEHPDFEELCRYARQFARLDDAKIAHLHAVFPELENELVTVTNNFYEDLQQIPKALPYLEGRVESLKQTHLAWLKELFTGAFDVAYTQWMYKVGDVHVKVKLPVEFMAGGMTIIHNELIPIVYRIYQDDPQKAQDTLGAINAAVGFSLLVMQESYQSSSLAKELEKFLAITGMSRKLFNNLAAAYAD